MASNNRHVITDPATLAGIVRSLGGSPIPGRNFTFDLPLSEVRETVPKIAETSGLGCRRVSERVDEHPTKLGCNRGVVTIELYRK
jgi:hypothetical protein